VFFFRKRREVDHSRDSVYFFDVERGNSVVWATHPSPESDLTYVVQICDTLPELAARFYGDQAAWNHIWEANRHLVPDPDRLEAGVELRIPSGRDDEQAVAKAAAAKKPPQPATKARRGPPAPPRPVLGLPRRTGA